jgi:hypothetical protein
MVKSATKNIYTASYSVPVVFLFVIPVPKTKQVVVYSVFFSNFVRRFLISVNNLPFSGLLIN